MAEQRTIFGEVVGEVRKSTFAMKKPVYRSR